ncbi:MAG TPA: hypothetical protein VHG32_09660 [Thermoanaerobaculia bacterium]|jgi:hypothetical protein|nr:hypothetical protein [Thermoanaerobaculia bacterium]
MSPAKIIDAASQTRVASEKSPRRRIRASGNAALAASGLSTSFCALFAQPDSSP